MSNFWTDDEQFNRYVSNFGSRFAAVVYVSELARIHAKRAHNRILESEAISWVLTGDKPQILNNMEHANTSRSRLKLDYILDKLCYVEDIDVRDAVYSTLKYSIQASHLIYVYNNIKDVYRQSRVRVLSNMLWDELHLIDIEYATR